MVLLLGAFVWRQRSRSLNGRQLDAALADADPQVRRAALESIGERWIGPHAVALVDMARKETDPEVMAALISLVGRHQWEPADRPALVELRKLVLRWLTDPEASNTAAPDGTLPFDPAALLAWLTAALGEPLREIRIQRAEGSVVLRPPSPPPSSEGSTTTDEEG